MYTDEHFAQATGIRNTGKERKVIVYARVSSQDQKPDLENQRVMLEQFCAASGIAVSEWVTEIGGGLNFKRPKFVKLVVSIQVEVDKPQPVPFPQQSVGVDVGIKALATLSDSSEFENQKPLRSQISKLRKLNRSLSRRQEGSNRWWKAKRKLERFYYRIANQRADAHHKASQTIASTYAFIGVEDLHVKGMVKNRRLSLAISDVGLGEFIRQIEYKAEALGGTIVKVGRFFASSKTCSDCGYINGQLTLADRKWTCAGCGVIHQRDWNAAINIEQEALRIGS